MGVVIALAEPGEVADAEREKSVRKFEEEK